MTEKLNKIEERGKLFRKEVENLISVMKDIEYRFESLIEKDKVPASVFNGDWPLGMRKYVSNIGSVWKLVLLDEFIREYALPDGADDIGTVQNLHGDYSVKIRYMDTDQVLEAAQKIPWYVNKVAERIREFNEKAKELHEAIPAPDEIEGKGDEVED